MRAPTNTGVRWIGRAATPALAVACPTCNAAIGEPCSAIAFALPHRRRADYAAVLGFVAVKQPGGLFKDPGL